MALGTITVGTGLAGKMASAPLKMIPLSFDGDDDYTTGGTLAFEDAVQAATGESITVLTVLMNGACGGYTPRYIRSTDALMVLQQDCDAVADSELIELGAAADVSGTTFEVVVVGF